MGFLSRVFKGFKKIVKKVAKGVKKVFNKIGKAFGKFGILGQIGMMFFMPYAMNALGINGLASGALGKIGEWSQTLLSKSGIGAKALGTTLDVVHRIGTGVGNVYNSITDTIDRAWEGTKEFFGVQKDGDVLNAAESTMDSKATEITKPETPPELSVQVDTSLTADPTEQYRTQLLSGTPPVETTPSVGTETVAGDSLMAPKEEGTWASRTMDKIKQDIRDFDVYDYAKKTVDRSVSGGLNMAMTQKVAKMGGYEIPNATYTSIDLGHVGSRMQEPSVFNEVDLTFKKSGNFFMGTALRDRSMVNDMFAMNTNRDPIYESIMKNLDFSMAVPKG